MAIQFQGNNGIVADVDGTAFRALRVTPRPTEYGTLGHYRLSTNVPLVVTQAANGTLFSFRWADATRFCVIQRIRLSCLQTAAATATIMPTFQAFMARAWTVADSGGTTVSLAGNNSKKRTNMGTSLVTGVFKSAAAAGVTVGTRTLDGDPMLEMPTNQSITTPNPNLYLRDLDLETGDGIHPYVLAQNEGFIVRGPTVVFGAAGTANLVVDVAWAEVASF